MKKSLVKLLVKAAVTVGTAVFAVFEIADAAKDTKKSYDEYQVEKAKENSIDCEVETKDEVVEEQKQ